ncbi:MAG: HAD family hydrolase [Bacteroidetes bacterium]|nr:MAG: HAD family hydrolase [Bacteroidota bacterium]
MFWHTEPSDVVMKNFGVIQETGLSSEQVIDMREKFGDNTLISTKEKPAWVLLLEQFNDPVIYILIVAAVLNAFLAELKDTFVIAAVVILNTLIGFVQERRASDALNALMKMTAPSARVIRDGIQQIIPAAEVVVGDIIILESGVRVPADARLIESQNLLIDESMLTGESFSITKNANAIISRDAPLGDRYTMLYSGTIVQKGRGIAIVTAVGNQTEFGKISVKVAEAEETVSPLGIQMAAFGKFISISIMAIVVIIFLIGYLRGNDWLTMFLTSVGLAVSAIPEGLPVAVTITLSIGLSQMAKQKAIVKKLAAVETLGSTNIICTDKTGTLTRNQMAVTRIYSGGELFDVVGSGYSKEGQIFSQHSGEQVFADDYYALNLTALVGSLCTESVIKENGTDWEITGDPTEIALMIAAKKLGFNSNDYQVNVDIPFESENQLMAVRAFSDNNSYILSKGAPEKILNRCTSMIDINGAKIPLNVDGANNIIQIFSEKGLRVLALAYTDESANIPLSLDSLKNLIFIGFAGIEDTVRPEAVEAVSKCRNAGIRVVMITGDHAKTAQSVAKTVGIGKGKPKPVAINGVEIDKLTDKELYEKVPDIDVYARVAPHHKYRIVKQLQARGNIVAMTGDGVNDAPALKQADIGVAMGSGTDVAKESAHMVLIDDNFATIVKAVRRGRVVLRNLQHIILYILSTSFGGLLTIATSVAFGFPLPVLPAQLLWINLVTDGTSTFPLAFEKEHGDVMVFLPRKKDSPLINKRMVLQMIISGLIMMIGTLIVFNYYLPDTDIAINPESHDKARTMAFCILAFFQIWNVQNSRSFDRSLFINLPYAGGTKIDRISPFKNPILIAVMLLAIALQISAVAIPVMNELLDTVPLSSNEWLIVMCTTFSIIIIIEIYKICVALINKMRGTMRQDVNIEAIKFYK